MRDINLTIDVRNVDVLGIGGGGGGGTSDHRRLSNLDDPNQHVIPVITGLQEKHNEQDLKIKTNEDNIQSIIDSLRASDFLHFEGEYDKQKTDYKIGSVVQYTTSVLNLLYLSLSDNPPANSILNTKYWNVFRGDIDLTNYYTKLETDALLNKKQDNLVAGSNITINGDTISATGGGETDEAVFKDNVTVSLVNWGDKQNSLTAGNNITISGDVVSSKDTIYDDSGLQDKLDKEIADRKSADSLLLPKDLFTAKGSILIGTGTVPNVVELPIGEEGEILQVKGGTLAYDTGSSATIDLDVTEKTYPATYKTKQCYSIIKELTTGGIGVASDIVITGLVDLVEFRGFVTPKGTTKTVPITNIVYWVEVEIDSGTIKVYPRFEEVAGSAVTLTFIYTKE